MRANLLVLLTTLAFMAALFVVLPRATGAKRGDPGIGAARLAMVHAANAAKPSPRKADGSPGSALSPRVFAIEPAFVFVAAKEPAKQYVPTAPDCSELMVFLN